MESTDDGSKAVTPTVENGPERQGLMESTDDGSKAVTPTVENGPKRQGLMEITDNGSDAVTPAVENGPERQGLMESTDDGSNAVTPGVGNGPKRQGLMESTDNGSDAVTPAVGNGPERQGLMESTDDGSNAVTPAVENGPQRQTSNNEDNVEIEDYFICPCDRKLFVRPTTLTCGHTICRPCLATNVMIKKRRECPLCNIPFEGDPQINVQLRNVIERRYPQQLREREELSQKTIGGIWENVFLLLTAQRPVQPVQPPPHNPRLVRFIQGVFLVVFILVVLLVVHVLWLFLSGAFSTRLMDMQVETWRSTDVETWLNQVEWAKRYSHIAVRKGIDGKQLMLVDEDDLIILFELLPVDSNAFVHLIKHLKHTKVDTPTNVWDYGSLMPGKSLFLLTSAHMCPRATVVYVWLFHKEDVYHPFMKAITEGKGKDDREFQASDLSGDAIITSPTWSPDLLHTAALFVIPEYFMASFVYNLSGQGFFTTICLWLFVFGQLSELLYVLWNVFFSDRLFSEYAGQLHRSYINTLTMFAGLLVFAWVLPSIILRLMFIIDMYYLIPRRILIFIMLSLMKVLANLCVALDLYIAF